MTETCENMFLVLWPSTLVPLAGLKVGAYLVANATKIISLLLKYVF
jgi:hypothetical protein